ncbi:Palmitoyltransferase [Hyphodiscus hymeniophilus]|uniref:Palmitoyltransferase n=1 Tax=Hyphodiscus hymeniophilus TaxID=353542 RepID=A0A9P7AYN8_9HELO|nr:Palmitoyltransferase [Hyphodiscus hymeniophilus]
MLTPADRNRIAVNIWTAKVIPVILAGIVGYATYVLVALCCGKSCTINYVMVKHNDNGAAIPILVTYFLLFILMTTCFLRLVHITTVDPPYVPLGAAALRDRQHYTERATTKSQEVGIAMGEYNSGNNSGGTSPEATDSYNDPDSPGLELFYTKDVFICSTDGRPIWCSECSNWKPDRTHHDSSSGRCIRKMDHFCPWSVTLTPEIQVVKTNKTIRVGGPVGENNFKFFIQFNAYTALYCFHLLVVMAYYIHKQGEHVNRHFIAILALATFFGLFTGSMAGTSLNLAALNLTQVERLGGKTKLYILAILKTAPTTPSPTTSLGEITYPLDLGYKPESHATSSAPVIRANGNTQLPQDVNRVQIKPSFVQDGHNTAEPSQNLPAREFSDRSRQAPIFGTGGTSDTAGNPASIQDIGTLTEGEPKSGAPIQPQVLSQGTALSLKGGIERSTTSSETMETPGENVSSRDSRATRTFVVLKMLQPGDNPWDLGSARLNLETVMGTGFFDWLLPIRRSPCCDHEDSDSHFKVGPKVAVLRASTNPNQPEKTLVTR